MADIKFVVTGEYGIVSDNGKGTVMKLRTVSWNDRPEKFDLRSWYEKDGEERMNKGVTLTKEELFALGNLIDEIRKAEEKPKTKAKASTTTKVTTKAKSVACSARTAKTSTSTTKSNTKTKATGKATATKKGGKR